MKKDELIAMRQKRREAIVRFVAVFASLSAAAAMVFFVVRLVRTHMENDRKLRETAEGEREYFEATMSTQRVRRDDSAGKFNATPRKTVRKSDAVDMSSPGAPLRAGGVATAARDASAVDSPSSKPAAASGAKGIEKLEEKQPAIADALRKFFKAGGIPEMLPLVRDAERVRPLMEEYYQRNPLKNRTWKGIGWSLPVEEPGYRFAYVQAIFTDGPPVNVVVEETDSGFLVDWESSVQYSEIGWREFMATKPAEPKVFRVIASKAESGDGRTVLSLKHPREEGEVIGRFDLRDPRFRSLVEQLELCKWKDVPVILRLCYPGPAAESNEVQIAGVEGKGWLILDDRARGS